jgi:energy-coupling factor transporter ATP-binding protein EcfA2
VTDLFSTVAGQSQALDQLRSQVESDRLAHAYLFVGESGLGKTTVARLLAETLLPEAGLGRHPDYWEDDRIKPLSINEIRLLPEKPPEFHELSLQAFLNLKPTVVSRCQRVFFHPVPSPEIEKLLSGQGVDGARAHLIAELARGRPGWAARVAGDQGVIELHREWTRRLDEVFGAPADVPLRVAAELDSAQMGWRKAEGEAEDPALFAIASWQIELRKRMLASRGREQGRWARLIELSYDTLGYLEQNVSPRLALETFLLECRKAS